MQRFLAFLLVLAAMCAVAPAATATAGAQAAASETAGYYFLLGRRLERDGKIEAAVAALKRGIELAPRSAELRAELAGLYAREQRAIDAVTAAEDALKYDAPNVEANRILGSILAALADQKRVLRPGDDPAGYAARAISALEKARGVPGSDLTIELTLGRLYLQTGRDELAISTLREFFEQQPQQVNAPPELRYGYATALMNSGDHAGAERHLRALITSDPLDARALNSLGYMFAERGERLDEAVSLLQRALKIVPGNPSILDSLGWAFFKQGRLELADPPLTEAAGQMLDNSVIQDHLGDLRFRQERFADAVTAWERSLAGDGESIVKASIEKKLQDARSRLQKK